MLTSRLYQPSEGETLYHYCSAETLLAICTNRTLRFSDIFSMNDFLEMHWGYSIWERVREKLNGEIDQDLLAQIDAILKHINILAAPLATCLSTDGDVLSQWRAYSQDGTGYAVGFRAEDLAQLQSRPLRVLYSEVEQLSELERWVRAIASVESNAEDKFSADFFEACYTLAIDLASFKNPAFREEQEVRLLHTLNYLDSNNSRKLVSVGGSAFGEPCGPSKLNFLMKQGTPCAYVDINFSRDGNINPIVEVIVGPKNSALLTGISVFLETLGHPNVVVRKSQASYR